VQGGSWSAAVASVAGGTAQKRRWHPGLGLECADQHRDPGQGRVDWSGFRGVGSSAQIVEEVAASAQIHDERRRVGGARTKARLQQRISR
jgi:hypothetical protein